MEDLLSLLVIVFAIVGVMTKNMKNRGQRMEKKQPFHQMPPVTAPQAVKQRQTAAPETTMMPPKAETRPVTPLETMAARAEIEAKQADGEEWSAYSTYDSGEGETDHSAHLSCEGHDPCHEDELRPLVRPAQAGMQDAALSSEEETGSLDLQFTGDEMVRAFVMQEILKRPCERRGRVR